MALVGTQKLDILVESFNYPNEIKPVIISVMIEVESCEVADLIEPEDSKFSSLYLAFDLPLNLNIYLPLYEPSPSCNLSNADVEYRVVDENNSLPDWVTFDADSRTLTAYSNDSDLIG